MALYSLTIHHPWPCATSQYVTIFVLLWPNKTTMSLVPGPLNFHSTLTPTVALNDPTDPQYTSVLLSLQPSKSSLPHTIKADNLLHLPATPPANGTHRLGLNAAYHLLLLWTISGHLFICKWAVVWGCLHTPAFTSVEVVRYLGSTKGIWLGSIN